MEKIFEILTDCTNEEDVRDLWEQIFSYSDKNKYSAHNLVMGYPQCGDTILWQQLVNHEPNTMGWAQQKICYPPEKSVHLSKAVITGIAVIDVKNDKCGGNAEIISGGVGAESVQIRLKADFWRGMTFQVIIIGRYLKTNNEIQNQNNLIKENNNPKDKRISYNFNLN